MHRTTGFPLIVFTTALLLLGTTLSGPADAQVPPAAPAVAVPTHERASVRLKVAPKHAQVFLDGYYVGMAGDYDGIFSRLHTRIGEHEITLYLEGYRTLTQRVRLGRSTYLITHGMAPLAEGETAVKPPAVAAAATALPAGRDVAGRRSRRAEAAPPYQEPAQPGRSDDRAERRRLRDGDPRGGRITIRVQPTDAEVFIDGERWQGPDSSRLVVEVPEGTHRVEVSKPGFERYSVNVQVRRGETTTVNVTLATGSTNSSPAAEVRS